MGGPGSGRKKGSGANGSSFRVGKVKLTKKNGQYSHKGVVLKNKKEAKHYLSEKKKGNYFLVK
jgi:hypothetical protein